MAKMLVFPGDATEKAPPRFEALTSEILRWLNVLDVSANAVPIRIGSGFVANCRMELDGQAHRS